jgi:hypothetical protein
MAIGKEPILPGPSIDGHGNEGRVAGRPASFMAKNRKKVTPLSPKLRQLVAAVAWIVATSSAAFVGGAATVLACSQSTNSLWLAEFSTLALLPSVAP